VTLGTNDFAGGNLPEEPWTQAYAALLAQVRSRYRKAEIYCATSPMLSDQWAAKTKPQSTLLRYVQKVAALRRSAGDTQVHTLEFAPQDGANGFGTDWQPSVKTHAIMAGVLEEVLHRDLGWAITKTAP